MRAARVSTVVMFHLEMSSSDATRDTEPSTWTSLSETPDGKACKSGECVVTYGSVEISPKTFLSGYTEHQHDVMTAVSY